MEYDFIVGVPEAFRLRSRVVLRDTMPYFKFTSTAWDASYARKQPPQVYRNAWDLSAARQSLFARRHPGSPECGGVWTTGQHE